MVLYTLCIVNRLDTALYKHYIIIIYSGGIFRVYIKFDEHFNAKPPEICFHTIPFHPNSKFKCSDSFLNCNILNILK